MKRTVVASCVALGVVGTLSAAATVRGGGEKASSIFRERDLVVTLVTPTVNQEVLADLSDPGLNNVITVRFSSLLHARDIIDTQNVVNQLSAKTEFLDATFARLPGTPSVRRNVFTFDPFTVSAPVLATGQYTLNLKSSIRNTRGRMLNSGAADYSTTFTVGTDVFPPVLRKMSPIEGQTNIGLLQPIVATFNEPIDRASALANIAVVNASANPPTIIPGAGGGGVTFARGDFDVIFTPDPCFGYPPKSNIQFLIQGNNPNGPTNVPPIALVPNTLTDRFGNRFTRDPGLQWQADPTIPTTFHSPNGVYDTLTGVFSMQFQTKGARPAPSAPRAGGPMNTLVGPFPNCQVQFWAAPACVDAGQGIHYTTNSSLGELDLRGYINRFNQGVTDFSLITLLANAPVRLGRPAGLTFDPRLIPPVGGFLVPDSMHTFIYVVDEQTATVEVVRSDSFKVIGRFVGFQDPRDVGVSTNPSQSATTLYVSNFGSNELIGIDLEGIAVTFGGQPGAQSPCAAIKDNQGTRARIVVGQGPTEVSPDCYIQSRVMVCNSLSSSISMIDPRTNKLLKSYDVGSNPVSCDWNTIQFGRIKVALIANQGGLNDPNGSVSLYINSPPLNGGFLGAGQVRDAVESTLTTDVKNPTHVWGNQKWIDPPPPPAGNGTLTSLPIVWYVSNTGGNTVLDLRLNVAGIFGLSITPQVNNVLTVGPNPSSACLDAYFPSADLYTSVLGTGSVAAQYPVRTEAPVFILAPGVRRLFTPFSN
jgi:hypothetical protein